MHWAPGLPCALYFSRDMVLHNSGKSRREIVELCLPAVIARSQATKQSIPPLRGAMDCFASLAMTVRPFENRINSCCPGLRRDDNRYPAPTFFFRQARCTAQVQPGGCEAISSAATSLAGVARSGVAGIASLTARSCLD